TVVTNAIVERRGARVGLVTTRGFRDVLEIARQSRLHLYDLRLPPKPEPLVERRLRLEVGERVGPDGAVLLPLALDELPAIVEALERGHVESVAVCLLHSYANPAHERALKAALAPHFAHLSVSSEINAEFREYERSSTTVLNAAVMPLASRYLDELVTTLGREARGAVLHLLHSAGGMMSAEAARARPRLRRLDPRRSRAGRGRRRAPGPSVRALARRGGAGHGRGREREHAAGAAPGVRPARLRPSGLRADRLRRRRARARRPAGTPGRDHARHRARPLGDVLGARVSRLTAPVRRRADVAGAPRRVGPEARRGSVPGARRALPPAAARRRHRGRG